MSDEMLKKLLTPKERAAIIQEIRGTTKEIIEFNQLIEKLRRVLEQIPEQLDLTPILERLDIIGQILADIAVKVDLSAEEEEVLTMLKTELSKK